MKTKTSKADVQNMIDQLKGIPGVPKWMLDPTDYDGSRPLTPEELHEFAEFHTKQLWRNAALYYLNNCAERFGFDENGQRIFRAPGVVVEIDQDVIETLLIYQVERCVMQERPEDKYLAPMRFYMGDEINRKENGSTWLIDFIDGVFTEGASEFKNLLNNCSDTAH